MQAVLHHSRFPEVHMVRVPAGVCLRSVLRLAMSALLVAAALPIATASAQTSTGGLRGFVKDDTGGVLAGVTVEASSPSRIGAPAVEVTDAQGLYRFENLPIGEYSLAYTLQGFGGGRPARGRGGIRPPTPGGAQV